MRPTKTSAICWLAAPWDGPRIAVAEFECTVYVFDLKSRKRISVFETPFDPGGSASPSILAATFVLWVRTRTVV